MILAEQATGLMTVFQGIHARMETAGQRRRFLFAG
jgi:hypothetical protein